MKTRKNFYRDVSILALLLALFFVFGIGNTAHAHNSKAWRERLAERTATLWVEGQFLGDGIVLNARGELNVMWLERGLNRVLETDNDVDEPIADGLGYYLSSRKETRAKLKERDVFVLNYKAHKNWSFDPAKLTVNGYAITPNDILTDKIYWESELAPDNAGSVAVAAPSLKPGQTVELKYEDAVTEFKAPRLRVR